MLSFAISLKRRDNSPGFSALELLVSISIIAALIALTIPTSTAALGTLDFLRCVSLRSELGQATLLYADDKFGENPEADSVLPFNIDQLLTELKTYGVRKEHFVCPAVERKMPEVGGDAHFIPTGVFARSLKQVDASSYVLYFEIYDIHGNGRVYVMGDGSAKFLPDSKF